MTPLDPIASLAITIAEAPGSCALFLGSGVSTDAGVPTGAEVYWIAVGDLYKAEEVVADVPDRETLRRWLEAKGRADLGYSGVLGLFGQGTRRDYVAKLFEGIEPGPTHRLLAEMAVRGLVKVFITTNFDRLLENALRARGIDPVVVSSEDELARTTRREHAQCFVLKPHGDYQQMTIRNTPSELAELETGITAELQEVVDRYGLVVVGYSGSDEAVANTIRRRQSRYGLWWVSIADPAPAAAALIEATGGRLIKRDSAEGFLTDLIQRIGVLEAHPTGLTPEIVHDEVLALVRRGDRVGLDTLLRRERDAFEEGSQRLVAGLTPSAGNAAAAEALRAAIMPIAERRLASLLPLAVHDAEKFHEEMTAFMDAISRQRRAGGYLEYLQAPQWVAWWCCYAVGALVLRERKWPALRTVLEAEFVTPEHHAARAIDWSGETGRALGQLIPPPGGQHWLAPEWTFVERTMGEVAWLADRYPGFVKPPREPQDSLVEFSVVATMSAGLREQTIAAYFGMYEEAPTNFLLRLYHDRQLRADIAGVVGLDPAEFAAPAAAALNFGRAPRGAMPFFNPLAILSTGRN